MIYFSSDWHIGHDKEFLWGKRGFSSIEEHDTAVLLRCNEIVGPEDELWILGDLAMGGNEKEWNRVYNQLVCQNIHYLQGNHDTDNKMDIYDGYGFEYHGYADVIRASKKMSFYLSHYPTMMGNHEEKQRIWNLSGHTHDKNKFQYGQYCVYNVALDAHNCYPVSMEQILSDIRKYTDIQR